MHVWLNGRIVDAANARVPIDDHGLVVGDGAFETLRTVRGEAFAVRRHLRRLRHSLEALSIAMPDEGRCEMRLPRRWRPVATPSRASA